MDDPKVSPKQFTLRRAFMSIFLIAVGAAMLFRLLREIAIPGSVVLPLVLYPVWFGGGAFIGAGLAHLNYDWAAGAILSIPFQNAMLFVLTAFFPNY